MVSAATEKKVLRSLIIEDSEDDAELIGIELATFGYQCEKQRVENKTDLIQALQNQDWDIILSDFSLPSFSGLEALEICKKLVPEVPFIVVSGKIGEDTAVTAMKAGANDYLMKGNLTRLGPAIKRELREAEIRHQQVRAENALRESERKLKEAQAVAHLGDWILTVDTNTIEASAETGRILGFFTNGDERIFFPLEKLKQSIHLDDRHIYDQLCEKVLNMGLSMETDCRIMLAEDTTRWVYLRCQPVFENNRVKNVFGAIMDITERKLIEENLLASQKMAYLGMLAAGVAHEINSPLQVITGASERLLSECDGGQMIQTDLLRRKLDMIHRNAWRVAEIIRALLIYVSSAPLTFREENINDIVKDAVLLMNNQLKSWANIHIEENLAQNLPLILCDYNQILQVIVNVLTNARDAMPFGGQIKIRSSLEPGGERILLQIVDTGSGISKDHLTRIFDPFFTTKPTGKGTGLGLSIVTGIIQSHGGEIKVESELQYGTEFSIYLPLKRKTGLKNAQDSLSYSILSSG